MTDNEIIKALGYCKRSVGAILCTRECPMYSECDSEDPMVDICGLAVDLISRQKAEIEEVKTKLKYYLETNEENGVVYIPKFIIDNLVKEMTEVSE